jgi:two-component system, LuxR family, sensor kinase FixL
MEGFVKVKDSHWMPCTIAIVGTAFAILAIDAFIDVDIAIPVLYVAVVLMSACVCERRSIIGVALICILFTTVGYALSPGNLLGTTAIVNRLLAFLAIGITTFLVLRDQSANKERDELASIVASSDDAIYSIDLNDRITSWNSAATRIFGYKADEIVGQPITRIIPSDLQAKEMKVVARLQRGEQTDRDETVRVAKGGRLVDVAITVSPLRDKSGNIVGASEIGRNITDRKRAEEALRASRTELAHVNRVTTMGQLTAKITHEVNQPIAAALNNAAAALRFLDRNPPDLAEVREAVGCVVADARRAGDIIGRFRDHVRKSPPQKVSIDLTATIKEVICFARSEVAKNEVSVQTRFVDGLAPVYGDRVQLQQVVFNLVLNAVEAMSSVRDGGCRELLVSTEQCPPHNVIVAVRDTGPGIDPLNRERAFEAFYTTKSNGMGLGLSICRSIIEAHGGRLSASNNNGAGATFQVILPAGTQQGIVGIG